MRLEHPLAHPINDSAVDERRVVRPRAWKRLTNARDVRRSPPAPARTPLGGLHHLRAASWRASQIAFSLDGF